MIQARSPEAQETEPIRETESPRPENGIPDAPALSRQKAVDRLDLSEETRVHLLHREPERHYDSGDYARAVATYDRILPGQEDPVAHANRGLAYRAMGDIRRAVEDYEQAPRMRPTDLIVLRSLGELHNHREEYPLALNSLRAAAALNSEDAATLCALGVTYYNLEDWLLAYKALTRAVELDPKNRVARLGKSKIEREFGLSEDT